MTALRFAREFATLALLMAMCTGLLPAAIARMMG